MRIKPVVLALAMVAVLALAAPRAEAQFFGGYVGFGNTGVYGVGGPVVVRPGRRGPGRPVDAGLSGRGRPRAHLPGTLRVSIRSRLGLWSSLLRAALQLSISLWPAMVMSR